MNFVLMIINLLVCLHDLIFNNDQVEQLVCKTPENVSHLSGELLPASPSTPLHRTGTLQLRDASPSYWSTTTYVVSKSLRSS